MDASSRKKGVEIMAYFRSTKGSIISDYFKASKDIGIIPAGEIVDLALYADHLELTAYQTKDIVTLSYEKITDVFLGKTKAIIEVNKSPIGRAIVGGILFGNIGATVGAASGHGKTKTVDPNKHLIIRYISNNQEKSIQLIDVRKYKAKTIYRKLLELCNIPEKETDVQKIQL